MMFDQKDKGAVACVITIKNQSKQFASTDFLVMESSQLLLCFCGEMRDVADPWYTGDFEQTWQDVLRGCTALLDELTGAK